MSLSHGRKYNDVVYRHALMDKELIDALPSSSELETDRISGFRLSTFRFSKRKVVIVISILK